MHRKFVLVFVFAGVVLGGLPAHAAKSPYDWALIDLDYARAEKASRLRGFCEKMLGLARAAASDPLVHAFFQLERETWERREAGPLAPALSKRHEEVSQQFDAHYIANYFAFYDLIFVEPAGTIFYTIRRESDLQASLLAKHEANLPLGRCLSQHPREERFVDFHPYAPSREPAAFFVHPLEGKDGAFHGWLVLQCAINRINSLFATSGELGETAETFLVNQEGYMLTESRFQGDSTILKQHLADENIQAKFRAGKGRRTVTDYRGAKALTSFEVVAFMGTKWLVVAKIDKTEVTTRHYAAHRRYYAERLLERIAGEPRPSLAACDSHSPAGVLRVDMDEFLRAGPTGSIETRGVSTCTAVLAAAPGRVAYLAHVSPKDRVYGGENTHLLGQITKKLMSFDLYPSERREVLFVVAAPHLRVLAEVTDALIAQGFFLSQIHAAYRPEALHAHLFYDNASRNLVVRWKLPGAAQETVCQTLDQTQKLCPLVEAIIAEDASAAPDGLG